MARYLLFTGKGGVGTTTVAAATAALLAERGHKTLVLSADPAQSLSAALGEAVGSQAREVAGGLAALQVDPQRRLEAGWRTVLDYLAGPSRQDAAELFGLAGVAAEEAVLLPGAADVLALLEVRDQVAGGLWDTVVLDCPQAAATVRLLALPETLGWYVRRAFPIEQRIARAMRPGAGSGLSQADRLLDAITRLAGELQETQALLADPAVTGIRLVLTPDSMAVAQARWAATALALHGYRVGGVVANRVIPAPAGPDPWRAAWAVSQRRWLAQARESFGEVPLHQARYQPAEPVGLGALLDLAHELYGPDDPYGSGPVAPASSVRRDGEEWVLELPLPFADRSEVGLARSGDELVLTVAGERRLLTLPSGLRRCIAVGAALRDGVLRVRFRPDPGQWPQ